MTGAAEPSPPLDADLAAYTGRLREAVLELCDEAVVGLVATLRSAREALEAAGPRLARDATWLAQREAYLVDAADALREAVARVGVALAAPGESDLSVRVAALRELVRYLADVSADAVPAPVYLDVGRDLLPMLEEQYGAPGLTLELSPLVEGVLARMRTACDLAVALTERADAVLAEPVPGGAVVFLPHQPLYPVHTAEIDRLLLALRNARPGLLARPREDDGTYARALSEGLSLTPRQLYAALARLGGTS